MREKSEYDRLKTVVFILLKFFNFSPIEIFTGNFSPSYYGFSHNLIQLTVSLPSHVDAVCISSLGSKEATDKAKY